MKEKPALKEAVRLRLQDVCTHPNAIQIDTFEGQPGRQNEVTLRGVALEPEVPKILDAVCSIPKITRVNDHIGSIHELQIPRAERMGEMMASSQSEFPLWHLSPILRAVLGAFGVSGVYFGFRQLRSRNFSGLLLAGFSFGAIIRSLTNKDTIRLLSRVIHPVILVHRIIEVNAPIENTFAFWTHFSNYSKFMSYVENVDIDEMGGLIWKVRGPGRVTIRWNTKIESLVPNDLLSWKSGPNAMVGNEGKIHFKAMGGDRTAIEVWLAYALPIGIVGQSLAKVLGFDPRDRIDGDLAIMKALLENESRLAQPA